jgi:acetyl esterase/lipase
VAALARTQRDLFVGGWSAGGHLAAMVAQTGLVRGGFALSGLFDLEPLLRTVLNEQIRLDEDSARRNSPLHGPAIPVPFEIAVGADELPELRRQSQAFAAARAARPEPGTLVVHPGLNHYTILDALGDPESAVVARTARLIGAPPAFVADGTPSERD